MNMSKVIQYARHARTELARDALAPEDDAMPPMVVFGRGGKTVATVFCKRVNRDDGLEVANIGIRGWAADEIVAIFDAHTRLAGKDQDLPERGSMQEQCETHNGKHTDGTMDILLAVRMTRDDDFEMHTIPYEVDYDAGEISWKEEPEEVANAKGLSFNGTIPDALRSMFSRDPLDINIEMEDVAGDDPIGRVLARLIKRTADPEQSRREFVDEIVSSMVSDRVPCTVVMTRESKEPL